MDVFVGWKDLYVRELEYSVRFPLLRNGFFGFQVVLLGVSRISGILMCRGMFGRALGTV